MHKGAVLALAASPIAVAALGPDDFADNSYNDYHRYTTQNEFQPYVGLKGNARQLQEESKCEWKYRKFGGEKEVSAYYAKSSYDVAAMDDGERVDLIAGESGSRLRSDLSLNYSYAARKPLIPNDDADILIGSCSVKEQGSDATWYSTRVGPMSSVGGFDWWTHYWADWEGLYSLMDQPDGKKLGVTATNCGPVDDADNFLPLPPIHNHHVHITPGNAGDVRSETIIDCFLHGKRCVQGAVLFQQDGDYQYLDNLGGEQSFGRKYHSDVAHYAYDPLTMWAQLNDVRPKGSAPLTWWYMGSLRVIFDTPGVDHKPLATFTIHDPARFPPPHGMLATTFWCPTQEDSILWWVARMPFGGTIAGADPHIHATYFHRAIIAHATPEQLNFPKLEAPHPSWKAVPTREIGYKSTKEVYTHMIEGVQAAALEWETEYNKTGYEGEGKPLIICDFLGTTELVDGTRYDRRSRFTCKAWKFKAGYPITMASMNGPLKGSETLEHETATDVVEKKFEGMSDQAISDEEKAATAEKAKAAGPLSKEPRKDWEVFDKTWAEHVFPQHFVPNLYYIADDGSSHYTYQMFSYKLDSVPPVFTTMDWMRMITGSETATHEQTTKDQLALAGVNSFIYVVDKQREYGQGVVGFVAIAVFVAGIALARHLHLGCCATFMGLLTFVYLCMILVNFGTPWPSYMCNPHDSAILHQRHSSSVFMSTMALGALGAFILGGGTSLAARGSGGSSSGRRVGPLHGLPGMKPVPTVVSAADEDPGFYKP